MQQESGGRGEWYHAGEVVIVARVPRGITTVAARRELQATVHSRLRGRAPDYFGPDQAETRSFVFDAPGEQKSLVFLFHRLAEGARGSLRAVRDAVEALHEQLVGAGPDDIELISAMPHWHMRAHEGFAGGSPGSFPRPVYPDQVPSGWRQRFYQPINSQFDLARAAANLEPVRVAVLDTRANLRYAHTRGQEFKRLAANDQMLEAVDWLRKTATSDRVFNQEFKTLDVHHSTDGELGVSSPGSAAAYPMPDHGLFIAGLIHGIAPNAPLTLEPALDELGRGDLSLLLLGLQRVLAAKKPGEPQIINLSLGFRPHPARLPAAWYGLPRPNDPTYQRLQALSDPGRDTRWVAANRSQIARTVDRLQIGLHELGTYLSLNNCLVIAAAGNDSLAQVEARQGRLEPRLPARLDSVLGVAATTSNPRQAARYSNVGDEAELGDHVATFGGNASDSLEPEEGVMGLYAGDFPDGRPNETGWAYWSGTSFATGIMSGIAANFWATRREMSASSVLADLHDTARSAGPYVPALRTPSIEVRGRWRR